MRTVLRKPNFGGMSSDRICPQCAEKGNTRSRMGSLSYSLKTEDEKTIHFQNEVCFSCGYTINKILNTNELE